MVVALSFGTFIIKLFKTFISIFIFTFEKCLLTCDTCILAKSHRTSYHMSLNKSSVHFALIHYDMWGPSPRITVFGHHWFVIFVDDYTQMTWLYLMKTKDEVFQIFQNFHVMIQN